MANKALWDITPDLLEQKIEKYKQDIADGLYKRASWPHLAAYLDTTEDMLSRVIREGNDNRASTYYRHAEALKRAATWVRGQMLSGPGWDGQQQSKAIFALKQDWGDGLKYTDKDDGKQSGPIQIDISFGGRDARSKDAFK